MMEEASTDEERYAQQRMRDMHELIDKLMSWFDDVQRLSPRPPCSSWAWARP